MEGPGYAELGNETISHFQSLQHAKNSQSKKWPQDTDQIRSVAIRLCEDHSKILNGVYQTLLAR